MQELNNSYLSVRVNSKGAELCSIYSPEFDIEYLWQANPAIWARHAPVLFPIVGKLKADTFYYEDKAYQLNQHGFARDKEYKLIKTSKESIVFSLNADNESLLVYPFYFELQIEYQLIENSIKVIYRVINQDEKIAWFSIGAHPAFNCPLTSDTKSEDYFLQFNTKENTERYLIENGLQTIYKESIIDDNAQIPIQPNLFNKDALVFKGLQSTSINLKNKINIHGVAVHFNGFPYMGIWSKPNAPFICIEPWHGITDSKQTDQLLVHKEGIIPLLPKSTFTCSYTIELF